SVVVWATTVGAVLGPNLIDPGARVGGELGLPPLGGPWVSGAAALAIAAVVIAVGLRGSKPSGGGRQAASLRAGCRRILRRPEGLFGLVGIASAHAVMVGIMAMSAVHLHGHGSSLRIVGIVISVHVAGMYALAPLFGWATDKFRAGVVVGAGSVLLFLG